MFSSRKSNGVRGGNPTLGTKSLRFRSSASAYLNRTASVATNQTTWTWSGWIKRGSLTSAYYAFFSVGSNNFNVRFNATTDCLEFYNYVGATFQLQFITTQVFRDPSAWYHIVIAMDTTQATSTNRTKLYVNGLQVTSFSTATYPTQNTNTIVNSATGHYLGQNNSVGSYYDGYLADTYLIDGQQLTPSSFASTNATTGQWSPAQYTGTFGTNGFYLPFNNTTSTTTLGYDQSGNANNWTTNNISLTAGSTYDSMNDVPVAYSATAANYAVMNPLNNAGGTTIQDGNLYISNTATNRSNYATMGMASGKWYWEITIGTGVGSSYGPYGISNVSGIDGTVYVGSNAGSWGADGASKYNNGSSSAYGSTWSAGTVVGIAFDANAGSLTFYKNGTSEGVAFSGLASTTYFPAHTTYNRSNTVNFGQQPWQYSPPSGYVALNTYNLPTPTIAQGNKYMDATLYTGNGTSQTITNAGLFQPDFVWAKGRSGATSHILVNAVTGANQFLLTDSTQAEATSSALVSAFTSSGFSIGSSTSINNSSSTYVGWQWKANGSGSSNTNGSITSTVSASTTSGFSVVTYTGTGSDATVGHGLGVVPSMIIGKARNNTNDWRVYHTSVGASNFLVINTSAASASGATWNSTTPTSTVFTVGGGSNMNVNSSTTYVAYCFAPVAGFSAFGSYTGNGSATGPFIYCGFQPKFIMTKRTNTTGDWFIWDSARNTYNSLTLALYPDLSNAEYNYGAVWNFTSNGFYPVSNSVIANNSGDTYIYMAFASNPFAYSNAF